MPGMEETEERELAALMIVAAAADKRDKAAETEAALKKATYWYERARKYKAKLERANGREERLIQRVEALEARMGMERDDEEPDRFSGI